MCQRFYFSFGAQYVLFNICLLTLAQIITKQKIHHHNYADHTLSPGYSDPIQLLSKCREQISLWMCQMILQLEKQKTKKQTEVIIFGQKFARPQVWLKSTLDSYI